MIDQSSRFRVTQSEPMRETTSSRNWNNAYGTWNPIHILGSDQPGVIDPNKMSEHANPGIELISVAALDDRHLISVTNTNTKKTLGNAVVISNAVKSYRTGQPILRGLNMTVPCGSIYGLLGSSGCGKTTMLSCIVGISKLDKGNIWIFGKRPGSKSIGIPGRNVGYMPQDISLYLEFSIEETMNYFGTLNGMTKDKIRRTRKRLSSLFLLPENTVQVGFLSGGQQRRVSFMVALLCGSPLLILDEPTVGVDPLIRQKIWLHLNELAVKERTTIIITTHYIEECKGADNVGIMKDGKLLAEQQTEKLLLQYESNNLEKIVLNLFRGNARPVSGSQQVVAMKDTNNSVSSNMATILPGRGTGSAGLKNQSMGRVRSLTEKNFIVLLRNPLLSFFVIFCAGLVTILGTIALGHNPKDLTIGVINEEVGHYSKCDNVTRAPGECAVGLLSCHFLNVLKKDSTFHLEAHDNESTALAATRSGESWGYLVLPANFSQLLIDRVLLGSNADNVTLAASEIGVRLDETSKLISSGIKVALLDAYWKFAADMLNDCGYDEREWEYSLKYGNPILGRRDGVEFREFMAPGSILATLFFFPIITTSMRYIKEKKSGALGRSLVNGVQTWEIILAYSISEFFIVLLQSIVNYLIMTQWFTIEIVGSEMLLVILFILLGYVGVAMGFLLGSVCTDEIQAALVAIAAFFPNILLSGVLWPPEGMVTQIQGMARIFPATLAGEAGRSMTSRGWEFLHPHVWPGFAIPVAYIITFFSLTLLYHLKVKG